MSRSKRSKKSQQRTRLRLNFWQHHPNEYFSLEALGEEFPSLVKVVTWTKKENGTVREFEEVDYSMVLSTVRGVVRKNPLLVPVRQDNRKIVGWVYNPLDSTYATKEKEMNVATAALYLSKANETSRVFQLKEHFEITVDHGEVRR